MGAVVRGKFGFSAGVGFARNGYSKFGTSKLWGGYYQTRPRKSGTIQVRMRYYKPVSPRREPERAWQEIFATGVSTWHGLTTSEKQYYNKLKQPARQSGFTRFMSKYLSENVA